MTSQINSAESLASEYLIDRVAAAFEEKWKSGQPRPIEEFIDPTLPKAIRIALVEELIAIEWELRIDRGESPSVGEYQEQFPGVNSANFLPVDDDHSQPGSSATIRAGIAATSLAVPPHALPEIPGYQVLERIGHGGAGVVYKAIDLKLKRTVAIKVLSQGGPAANEYPRFLKEAESLAQLHHPNIVQIFEIGEHAGKIFMVLEFVEGGTLREQTANRPHSPHVAACAIVAIAKAVGSAHSRGVIHRDIKPSNILLGESLELDSPSWSTRKTNADTAEVDIKLKVTDFGLAKRLDSNLDTLMTQTGTVMGTPSYMAPEQANGDSHAVGTAADIYSIGAVLYELLTGHPPHLASSIAETLRLVCEKEPVPPRGLQPGLPRDIETICLKCLEKDPKRRYATANDLAEDCKRFLRGEPVVARRASLLERAAKWVVRHPAMSAAIAISTLAFFVSVWQWRAAEVAAANALQQSEFARGKELEANAAASRAEQNKLLAQQREREARREDAESRLRYWRGGMDRGEGLNLLGDLAMAHSAEKQADYTPDQWRQREALARLRAGAMFERSPRLVGYWHAGGNPIRPLVSPAGMIVIPHGEHEHLVPYLSDASRTEVPLTLGQEPLRHLTLGRFDSQGRRLVAIANDGLVVIDCETGTTLHRLDKTAEWRDGIAISPSGSMVACLRVKTQMGRDGVRATLSVWETETGKRVGNALRLKQMRAATMSNSSTMTFSAEEDAIYVIMESGVIRVDLPFTDNDQIEQLTRTKKFVRALETAPNLSTKLVYMLFSGAKVAPKYVVFDTETGKEQSVPILHREVVYRRPQFGFAPKGNTFGYLADDTKIGLLDLDTGNVETHDYEKSISTFTWDPTGRHFAVAFDHMIMLTLAGTKRQIAPLMPHDDTVTDLTFDASGRFLLAESNFGSYWLWDLAPLYQPDKLLRTKAVVAASWSPEGERIAFATDKGVGFHTDDGTKSLLKTNDHIDAIQFASNGNRLLLRGHDHSMIVNLKPPKVVVLPGAHAELNDMGDMAMVKPNKFVALPENLGYMDSAQVHRHAFPGLPPRILRIGFSPHRQQALFTTGMGLFLAEPSNGTEKRLSPVKGFASFSDSEYLMTFAPDEELAFTANYERGLRGIDCVEGRIMYQKKMSTAVGIHFDGDPDSLLIPLKNGTLLRCDRRTGETLSRTVVTDSSIMATAMADSDLMAIANLNRNIVFWSMEANDMKLPPLFLPHDVASISFRPNGSELLTLTKNGLLELHRLPRPSSMTWSDTLLFARFLSGDHRASDKQARWNELSSRYPQYFQTTYPMTDWHKGQLRYALVEGNDFAAKVHRAKLGQLSADAQPRATIAE